MFHSNVMCAHANSTQILTDADRQTGSHTSKLLYTYTYLRSHYEPDTTHIHRDTLSGPLCFSKQRREDGRISTSISGRLCVWVHTKSICASSFEFGQKSGGRKRWGISLYLWILYSSSGKMPTTHRASPFRTAVHTQCFAYIPVGTLRNSLRHSRFGSCSIVWWYARAAHRTQPLWGYEIYCSHSTYTLTHMHTFIHIEIAIIVVWWGNLTPATERKRHVPCIRARTRTHTPILDSQIHWAHHARQQERLKWEKSTLSTVVSFERTEACFENIPCWMPLFRFHAATLKISNRFEAAHAHRFTTIQFG